MAKLPSGVKRRANGTLEKRFTLNGVRYSVYGKTTKEISEKEFALRQEINENGFKSKNNITMDKYYEEWYKEKAKRVKPNTLRIYSLQYKKHISPYIGKHKVHTIEKREIKALLNKIPSDLSAETYNGILRILKMLFKSAFEDDVISKNPMNGFHQMKDKEKPASETYHRALTVQEQTQFMTEMKDNFYYELVALLLSTGMRIGEVVCLEWTDIDTKNNVIHINKTMTMTEDGKTIIGTTPKSDKGKRDIPLTSQIKDVLASQKAKMRMLRGNDVIAINERIFYTPYGNMPSNFVVNMAIRDTLERLEQKDIHIEHFTAHALRDTFATRFIEQGGTPQTLKTILGHSTLAMTMDLYSHVLPNTKQKEMDNISIVI